MFETAEALVGRCVGAKGKNAYPSAQRCGKAENAPTGKTRYELAAHWLDPPILSLIRLFLRLILQREKVQSRSVFQSANIRPVLLFGRARGKRMSASGYGLKQ